MKYMIFTLFVSLLFCQDDGYLDSTKVRNPKIAWKLGLVPGIGQIYNGKYIKAIGTIMSEYFVFEKFIKYRKLNNIGMRNTYAWWIFGIYVWSILDSYIDAQLSTFPEKQLAPINDEKDSLRVNAN